MIEIKNVSKNYGKCKAVQDVSMVVRDGSIHGLIGENSAGKTTLIKTMVGIYKPDAGSVLYDGRPIFDNPEVLAEMGYVADANEYIPAYTVEGIARFYGRAFSGFQKKDFWEMNDIFQLNPKSAISSLSKGQKMRLAFMLNIARHPKYLVMDEPTSGIDPIGKKELLRILVSEVEKRGTAVLISSHHLGELESICDDVTMMKEGKTVVSQSLNEAKENYAKVQIVFPKGLPTGFTQWEEVLQYRNIGSIYTVILSSYDENIHRKIMDAGAEFMEVLDVSLEEMFLFANGQGVKTDETGK